MSNNSPTPMAQMIFMFSSSNELSKSFLKRVFSQEVLNNPRVSTLTLNRPTNTNIDKVLRTICSREGLGSRDISDNKVVEIRTQSGRDLRNAISTLQFYAAGKVSDNNSSKAVKTAHEGVNGRDDSLSLFHALGKFLYNKRVNPDTKKVEQMPYEKMKNPETRPK